MKNELCELLKAVIKERDSLPTAEKPPILLKIAPDLTQSELKDVANVVQKKGCKVDGLIISNTTTSRPHFLQNENKDEIGGLSGLPLKDVSTKMISDMYKLTKGKVTIIGKELLKNLFKKERQNC